MANNNVTKSPMPLPKHALQICQNVHKNHPLGIFYGDDPLKYSVPLMLLDASIVIAITHILRFVLKPLRQPRVVSEILGGIIMGPSVFGRSKMFRSYFFPADLQFLLKNLAFIGFIYFLFISGVRTDLTAVTRARKKHWYIALVTVFVPVTCTTFIAIHLRKSMEKEIAKASSIFGASTLFSISTFPVLQLITKELNLLSSEIGRLAMLIALISDIIGINCIILFEAAKQEEGKSLAGLWYFISIVVVMVSIFGGIRLAMHWIVRTTQQGKQVDQFYVTVILLGVPVMGFVTDMLGIALGNGPLWLGLAVPDGPPLGSILVEKSETIVMEVFMAFFYTFIGLLTDVSSMSGNWPVLQPIFLMALTGFLTKIIATTLASRFFGMSMKESLALSLLLSLRGQVELLLYLHWMDYKMITIPCYTMLVLLTIAVTAVATPLFSILYDPTRPYRINKQRNIQHNHPDSELRIVASILDEQSVAGIINLLEVSNSTRSSPFSVYAVELTELVARASPIFIDHGKEGLNSKYTMQSSIHRALQNFQEDKCNYINIRHYTSKTAKRSMYQDVCQLALVKQASLIILPFHEDQEDHTSKIESVRVHKRVPSLIADVLVHAPCSVAIFVHRGSTNMHLLGIPRVKSLYHVAVIFFGGADAREALIYAEKMAGNPHVFLTVVRLLSNDDNGDNGMEKKVDDGVVTRFWVKHERNNQIVYREVVVNNGDGTIAAIQSMNNSDIDLWIVGRKNGMNPLLIQGLSEWCKHNELGVVGDYLASSDFGSRASILVVQQQVLRG